MATIKQTLTALGSGTAGLGTNLSASGLPLLGFFPAYAAPSRWQTDSPSITQGSTAIGLVGLWLGGGRPAGAVSLLHSPGWRSH